MREVGQIDDRNIQHAKERITRARLTVGHINAARSNDPVRMRQAAGSHSSIDDAELIRSVLDDNAAAEEKWIGCGVNNLLAAHVLAHTDTAGDVVEAAS